MNKAKLALLLLGFCILFSCQKAAELNTREVVLTLPSTLYTYLSDSSNNNIPTLGRVLFYDSRLSVNNSISCSSCHKQALAFADNVPFSQGFEGKLTFRNSMPIQNLVTSITFFPSNTIGFPQGPTDTLSLFWDGREKLLKAMVLRPIANHVEMGITDLDALAKKLSGIPDYQDLFTKAYGNPDVTQIKLADALSQFLQSIVARSADFPLTALEQTGHELFFGKYNCNSCHQTQALNGYKMGGGGGFLNIGLDQTYRDIGLADVTGIPSDVGKFKIPTLHNVALTAPYMHDGRFKTLDDVLNHYSEGIQDHPNLDFRLRDVNNQPRKMNISYHDKQAIIAFLNTLTDYKMITDPKFSNPFRVK